MTLKTDLLKVAQEILAEAEDEVVRLRADVLPKLVTNAYVALDKAQERLVELQKKVDDKLV